MKTLRTTLLLFVALLCGVTMSAQDVKIYLNNGNKLLVPYEQLDSIVHISYTDKDFVDLGLSVKWASYNIGADNPEDTGFYFAWGEISPKQSYDAANSITYDRNMQSICNDLRHDAATATWGVTMRMPTKSECEELMNLCTWTTTISDGVSGMQVTGPNGNSIFLPSAGYRNGTATDYSGDGYYWSCDPTPDKNGHACAIHFDDERAVIVNAYRYYGFFVRPVCEPDTMTEAPM